MSYQQPPRRTPFPHIIHRPISQRQDAADALVRLADLWKNNWKEAEGRSKITLDMIQRAATDGARFLAHLDKQPTQLQ
ncbi:hypothetical protein L6R29_20640 [Myxococcota bacterium]|nr:hypothetical protein [Myxococcota bacterium]